MDFFLTLNSVSNGRGLTVKTRRNENYKELMMKKPEFSIAHSLIKINRNKNVKRRESTILHVYGKVDNRKKVKKNKR